MTVRILEGDCREVMRTLPERAAADAKGGDVTWATESRLFRVIVGRSSKRFPPSLFTAVSRLRPIDWGLRDYGVSGELGHEPTPEEYVANLAEVFREVKRVLRDNGTLWLNLGDSYASDIKGSGGHPEKQLSNAGSFHNESQRWRHGLRPKDLVGIPWRVAFALQADGWWLRSDIIWSKPNPMPESVRDRPTKAHEYLFLLSKRANYYYDQEAIREPPVAASLARWTQDVDKQEVSYRANGGGKTNGTMKAVGGPRRTDKQRGHSRRHAGLNDRWDAMTKEEQGSYGRNKRTVWTIATLPFTEPHYATFPEDLVKPCILAGTSERGVCPEDGAPWARVVKRGSSNGGMPKSRVRTTGWRATCEHEAEPVPATVLDPFGGSGTVGVVARRAGRRAILIELSPGYCQMARDRMKQGVLL